MGPVGTSELFKTAVRVLSAHLERRPLDQADESFLRREEGNAQAPVEELARAVIQRELGRSGSY